MANIDKFRVDGTTYDFIDSTARTTANAAVPQTRTVNSKALSSDITINSGDIPYDGTATYTSGTIGEGVTTLKNAITLANNGYSNIDTNFAHGYISTSSSSAGDVTTSESYKYEAVTPNLISFVHDISIKCNSGYEFLLFYYDSQGTYISRSGAWRNADTILSGSYFRVFIRLNPADTSANVPADVFAKNIYVDSELSYRIKTVENGLTLEDREITASNAGNELINTGFAHGRILTTSGHVGEVSVSANYYKYQAITPEAVVFSTPKTIKANTGYAVQIWWYDNNDAYVGRSANFVTEYALIANRKYRFFMRNDPLDTSANVSVDVFQDNVYLISSIGERVGAIEDKPLSTLPDYLMNNMAEKPLGNLSKGYILLSCDDGSADLATYTIPMLLEKEVPCTFGLFETSDVVTDSTYLATVVDAVTNHDCCVALHGIGTAQWTTYTESELADYLSDLADTLETAGITEISGAICPGGDNDDTSELVQAVAGGMCGAVFSGNRSDKIAYGSYKSNGCRSNMYDLDRKSAIGFADATAYQAAIDEAYDNHYILCPFWHDSTVAESSDYQAIIEGMIDYAKTKGLEFITMADLDSIT